MNTAFWTAVLSVAVLHTSDRPSFGGSATATTVAAAKVAPPFSDARGSILQSDVNAPCFGPDFYVVGHMANRPYTVDKAVELGANAVEMDLNFTRGGDFTDFHHGGLCSCTTIPNRGLCQYNSCSDRSSVDEMLTHLARVQMGVALVVFDAKVGDIRDNARGYSGNKVAADVVRRLYELGYQGNVILSVPKLAHSAFLASAADHINKYAPTLRRRIKYSIDQEGTNAQRVITQLRREVTPHLKDIAYGTGSSLAGTSYRPAVRRAAELGVTFTYIWTVDAQPEIDAYLDDGVMAIITDHPFRVKERATSRGTQLAQKPPESCQ
jgi:hypothetical protein